MHCIKCGFGMPDNAAFCPTCGTATSLSSSTPQASVQVTDKKGSKSKNWTLAIIFTAGVFVVGSALSSGGTSGTSTKDSAANSAKTVAMEPTLVTAVELSRAYDENEVAAQQRYGARPLLVSGKVTAITLDLTDDPVVQMRGKDDFSEVHFSLADEAQASAASVKKGDDLKLLCGSIGEVISTPILKECTFTDAKF